MKTGMLMGSRVIDGEARMARTFAKQAG